MARWILGLLAIALSGCGNDGTSRSNLFSSSESEALELGDPTNNLPAAQTKAFNSSSTTREFEVDLLNQSPLGKEPKIYLSDQDTFRISLKTLDFLAEEKEFPLIEADEIIKNGLPKVIPPKGYSVRLSIVGNQVLAAIKSTTSPEEPKRTIPLYTGNDDIILGDLKASLLLLKGTGNTLFFPSPPLSKGIHSFNHGPSKALTYHPTNKWFARAALTHCGPANFLSMEVGSRWDLFNMGMLQTSIQHIYQPQIARNLEMASIKYSTHTFRGYKAHFVFTTTLDALSEQALGGGISTSLFSNTLFYFDVIINNKMWSVSAVYELNL